MRIGELLLEDTSITYHIVKPSQITDDVLQNILVLIESGQQVSMASVADNLRRAEMIGYAKLNDEIIGVMVLKNPNTSYRKKVFDAAEVTPLMKNYPYELGYAYVNPKHRGRGTASYLLSNLVRNRSDVFATTREDNIGMISLLKQNRFVQAGKPQKSIRGTYNIVLWIKDK